MYLAYWKPGVHTALVTKGDISMCSYYTSNLRKRRERNPSAANFICMPLQWGLCCKCCYTLKKIKGFVADRSCTSLWTLLIYCGCVMLLHRVTLHIIVTGVNDKVPSLCCKFSGSYFHFLHGPCTGIPDQLIQWISIAAYGNNVHTFQWHCIKDTAHQQYQIWIYLHQTET